MSDIKVPMAGFSMSFTPNKSFGAPDTVMFHDVTNIKVFLNGVLCSVKQSGGLGSRKRRQRLRNEITRDKNNDRDSGCGDEYDSYNEYSLDTIDSKTPNETPTPIEIWKAQYKKSKIEQNCPPYPVLSPAKKQDPGDQQRHLTR